MFARIDQTSLAVVELLDVAELPPLHPDIAALYWPAPARTSVGDIFDIYTATYSPPPPEPLSDVQTRVLQKLSDDCEAAIESGFTSSALGAPFLYQSARDDQLNLVGAASAGGDMAFKCRDVAGVWDYRAHTATQLAQVLADGAAKKLADLQRFTSLKTQLMEAPDNAIAEAVVW